MPACLEPIRFVIPDDRSCPRRAPKPVGGYTETILRVIDVVFQALAQAAPDRVNGCAYGTINALSLAGHRQDGRRWVMFSFFGGGHGGNPEGDGLNHGNAPISTATIPPLEILEAAYPVMFTRWALRADSGGAGRASRRARRGLRDRAARGAGRRVPVRRARQASRRPASSAAARGAEPLQLPAGQRASRRRRMVSKMVGISTQARRAAASRDARRRRLRRAAASATPRRSRATCALGYVSREAARRDYGVPLDLRRRRLSRGPRSRRGRERTSRRGTQLPRRREARRPTGDAADDWRRRRRCRRHLHRPVLPRRGERHAAARTRCRRRAGDQARGLPRRHRRRPHERQDRGFDALAAVVHGTTVGTNALLERKGARTGLITTARLPRRAGDAPARPAAHLGPVGRVRAGGAARPAARGRRAHARRRHGAHAGRPGRGARRGAGAARARRRGGRRRSSSTPTPTPPTSARRVAAAARGLAQRATSPRPARSCRRSASSSAPRPRRSTPTCSRSSRRYLEPLDERPRRRRLRRRAADRAVERRRDVASTPRARLPVRTALSGPAAGVIAAGAHRAQRPASRTSSPATWAAPASTSR